jgi:tetratricopeptide (TPR) repeat protein
MSLPVLRSPARVSACCVALGLLLLVGAVIPLHRQTASPEGSAVEDRVLLLPPPAALRAASLGYRGMMADLVWLLTIQYLGGHLTTDRRVPELRRLVDTVVDLDPHFVEAYTLGALFLGYTAGDLAGAVALLERGIRHNPARWELPHDLARTYYLDLEDYPKALHWFQVADRMPGRPPYVPRLIARLLAATGHRETALELWEALRESATSDWVREIADREIAKLKRQAAAPRPHETAGPSEPGGRPQVQSPPRTLPQQKGRDG